MSINFYNLNCVIWELLYKRTKYNRNYLFHQLINIKGFNKDQPGWAGQAAARQHNAVAKQHPPTPPSGSMTSAMPGYGTGQPTGNVRGGVVGSHPLRANRGPGGTTTAHNTHGGGNATDYGYGTGVFTVK